MKEVNELDRIMNWSDEFRASVEVAVDNNIDDCDNMKISEFVDLCVDIASL